MRSADVHIVIIVVYCAGDMLIDVQDMTLATPSYSATLVHNLDLQVRRGERVLVAGPSGCGKTSLLRALGTLWTAGTGSIATPPVARAKVRICGVALSLGKCTKQCN